MSALDEMEQRNIDSAYERGYEAGVIDGHRKAISEAVLEIDNCWRRMHHGNNTHHHGMKRDLFLRFRKNVESLSGRPSCFGKNCHTVSDPSLCETCKSLEECKRE